MSEKYDPPESRISEVIEKTGGDPRKLAIAYLRAQKRARDAETAFGVSNDLSDALVGVIGGNGEDAKTALHKANQRLRRHKEISESN
jgi:hypothetical protein